MIAKVQADTACNERLRKNRMKKRIYLVIALLVVFIAAFIFGIQPVKKLTNNDTSDAVSVKEILQNELLGSISGMLQNKTEDFEFKFTEKDINHIITEKFSASNSLKIENIQCNIENGIVIFYLDTKLGSFIPTQVVLKTNIDIIDNEINVIINKASLGRVPIPKNWILKMLQRKLEKYDANISGSVIKIPIALPKAISIIDFQVSDRIRFSARISIQSMDDLMELFKYFGKKMK
ncbi:hypothetical protein acsn021_17870 [Anaerocolumna cellulosilytica]|uniref:Uncharacterized protein n=1 Tax=Anaerocolumna cellulosilytica TaxID=433286 RepID=A0A6S6R585_9FIRM|nr:hypothetical protein [Anaerocolumna cellulosilytica]MBB5194818.1 hypothetical protein [Anaerocolumna cellulosilytica]BCJ94218.1 hypothetical protein acsn021_17870 [Anaerocolumna cellulosilytica]